jgi:CHAD domain-containing protein
VLRLGRSDVVRGVWVSQPCGDEESEMASYRLQRGETITSELRRIAAEQTDEALAELEVEDPHEAIHQVRKRCKKVRALLRLVRTSDESLYERENAAYRDAARQVSDLRDMTGLIETFDLMAERHPEVVDTDRFAPIRDGLRRQREEATARHLDGALAGVDSDLRAARERIVDWSVPDDGFDALAGGLAKTYGRARDRMADAYDERTTAAFHEWRKRVKYHRYHVRLLQDCWEPLMKARRSEMHDLSDLLGEDHDLAELRAHLHDDPDRFGDARLVGEITALLDRRRAGLQLDARGLGERLFVASADDVIGRVRRYWDIWTGEHGEADLLPDETVAQYTPSPAG